MDRSLVSLLLTSSSFFLWSVLGVVAGEGAGKYLSPESILAGKDGKFLYIAETGASSLGVLDLASGKASGVVALPASPSGLALSSDGARVFITCGESEGKVLAISTAKHALESWAVGVGHSPCGPVANPSGKEL